jgi:hypothetical protein
MAIAGQRYFYFKKFHCMRQFLRKYDQRTTNHYNTTLPGAAISKWYGKRFQESRTKWFDESILVARGQLDYTGQLVSFIIILHVTQTVVTYILESKAVPLHAMEVLGGGGIAPTHSSPRH